MDNRKGELEMTHEQLEITLEDGFSKKQSGDNLHLILLLNDESKQQLTNRMTRRRRDLQGKTVALTISSESNDDFDDNIFFKLIGNDQAITLTKNDKLNAVITRCSQNFQTKLVIWIIMFILGVRNSLLAHPSPGALFTLSLSILNS